MTTIKKTLVLGASLKTKRYSNLAIKRLRDYSHEVIAIGLRKGNTHGVEIIIDKIDISDLNTITIYLNEENQKEYLDYMLRLNPKRIIFNPGAENPQFESIAKSHGIEVVNACTLVMLSTGQY